MLVRPGPYWWAIIFYCITDKKNAMRFEVLTSLNVTPYSLVDSYEHLQRTTASIIRVEFLWNSWWLCPRLHGITSYKTVISKKNNVDTVLIALYTEVIYTIFILFTYLKIDLRTERLKSSTVESCLPRELSDPLTFWLLYSNINVFTSLHETL
jgi:hypothetical protein